MEESWSLTANFAPQASRPQLQLLLHLLRKLLLHMLLELLLLLLLWRRRRLLLSVLLLLLHLLLDQLLNLLLPLLLLLLLLFLLLLLLLPFLLLLLLPQELPLQDTGPALRQGLHVGGVLGPEARSSLLGELLLLPEGRLLLPVRRALHLHVGVLGGKPPPSLWLGPCGLQSAACCVICRGRSLVVYVGVPPVNQQLLIESQAAGNGGAQRVRQTCSRKLRGPLQASMSWKVGSHPAKLRQCVNAMR